MRVAAVAYDCAETYETDLTPAGHNHGACPVGAENKRGL